MSRINWSLCLQQEKDICQEDTDKLARQKEVLLTKCAEAEDKNRKLRAELRDNQLKLVSGIWNQET